MWDILQKASQHRSEPGEDLWAASTVHTPVPPHMVVVVPSGKLFICFPLFLLAHCHRSPTLTYPFSHPAFGQTLFPLPGWRTGGGGSCLPARSLPVLLHKSRHPPNPWSWQPSAREQGDLLLSALCSLIFCWAGRHGCETPGSRQSVGKPPARHQLGATSAGDAGPPSHRHPSHPPGTACEPLVVIFIPFWLCTGQRVPRPVQGGRSLQRLAWFLRYLLLVAWPC